MEFVVVKVNWHVNNVEITNSILSMNVTTHQFDLVTKPWSMAPLPLVKTLQSMVLSDSGRADQAEELTMDQIVDKMTIKLPWLKR